MGWGRVETEQSGHGCGGIYGHGLVVERKRQRIGLLGRIGIGLLGLAVERERQRIVCGKSVDRCSEEGVVGSCHGKEEAEDQSVRSDRSVGSCCAKEKVENRAVGSCRGKGIVVAWSS